MSLKIPTGTFGPDGSIAFDGLTFVRHQEANGYALFCDGERLCLDQGGIAHLWGVLERVAAR